MFLRDSFVSEFLAFLSLCVTFFKNNEHKKINRKKKQPLNNNLQKNLSGKLNKDSIG